MTARKPICLKGILGEMKEKNYLNIDVVLGVRDFDKGLKEGKFGGTAYTREEEILRTQSTMRGLENSYNLAQRMVDGDMSVTEDSEAGLRGRLSIEMAFCLRRGGILLPSGESKTNVPKLVEEFIYEIQPNLRDDVQRELNTQKEGQQPTIIEGTARMV